MKKIDLLIVGAGPAGLSTAFHLHQLDPSWSERLVILDKAAHPRHKLCAGGLTRFGLKILRSLGFDLPLPIHHVPIHDARLKYGRRVIHFRDQPKFVVFQRAELDAYLAKQARERGIFIQENTPALDAVIDKDGITMVRFQRCLGR